MKLNWILSSEAGGRCKMVLIWSLVQPVTSLFEMLRIWVLKQKNPECWTKSTNSSGDDYESAESRHFMESFRLKKWLVEWTWNKHFIYLKFAFFNLLLVLFNWTLLNERVFCLHHLCHFCWMNENWSHGYNNNDLSKLHETWTGSFNT